MAALEGVNLVKTSPAMLQAVGQAAEVHEVEWAPLAPSEPSRGITGIQSRSKCIFMRAINSTETPE